MNWPQSVINSKLVAEFIQVNRADADDIEPGLLPAFRLFAAFQIAVLCIGVVIAKIVHPELHLLYLALFSIIWMVAQLAYLSIPTLPRRLGRRYLPIALGAASATPIAQRVVFYLLQGQMVTLFKSGEVANSGWYLLVSLLVPLVLIAWQYSFRAVIRFSISFFFITLLLPVWIFGLRDPKWLDVIDLSLSSSVTFVLVGYIITKLVNAQREKQQALTRVNKQLLDHAATVEQLAISHERNRLARDLHDTLAHTLSAVTVQLEAVDSAWDYAPAQARELLRKSLGNARSGLGETRRALRALRSAPLEDLGVVLALRTLAESTAARHELDLQLDLPDTLVLPPELEQNIYLIAQEALSNVAHHADARTLWVRLDRQDELITLKITDDGKGFTAARRDAIGHYGLQGMKERAEMIGGTLNVTSTPGRGTTVLLQISRRDAG